MLVKFCNIKAAARFYRLQNSFVTAAGGIYKTLSAEKSLVTRPWQTIVTLAVF